MKKNILSSIIASVLCFNSLCISPSLVKNVNAETFEIADSPYTFRGHTYYVFDGVVGSIEEAKKFCEEQGGYLAVINDMAENTFLFNMMKSMGYDSAYFGYSDADSEGNWKWIGKDTSKFVNWAYEEPNGGREENTAMFYENYPDAKWNDGNFGIVDEFICEWDSAVPHTPNEDGSFDLRYTGILSHEQHTVKFSNQYNLDLMAECYNAKFYYPNLSRMLSVIASSAYNVSDLDYNLQTLGFSDYNYYDYYTDPYDSNYSNDNCAYSISKKVLRNGETLVLIDVRGSYSADHPIWESLMFHLNSDWTSNLNIWIQELYGSGKHTGFNIAMLRIFNQLKKDLGGNIPTSNYKYIITGHSRGAGVSNLLAKKICDLGVPSENVFDYNFACPDVAKDINKNWNPKGKYDNIYNIGVAGDPVTLIPGTLGDAISKGSSSSYFVTAFTDWGKYGQTRWFSENWGSVQYSFNYHDPESYVSAMTIQKKFNEGRTSSELKTTLMRNAIALNVHCPVDAEIVDGDGKVLASVYGDEVYYNTDSDFTVVVWHEDDQKNFIILGRTDLQVNLVGTDEGTMDCLVSVIQDGELKTESIVYYEDVELYDGKEMRLEISEDGKNVADKLYVFNDEKNEIITPNFYAPFRLYGDINADGEIKVSDAVLLQKYILASGELTFEQGIVADMNQDESIDVFDMVLMRKRLIANK